MRLENAEKGERGMLGNFHTHTIFCDGKNTPEEMVQKAIENKFDAIGFSGHGYTEFDVSYCMKDTKGYILTVNELKEEYKNQIEIYLGLEEDAFSVQNRADFDYIIGSSHYVKIKDRIIPIDYKYKYLKEAVELCGNDAVKLAEEYYKAFCGYIKKRKPDIVGHFDLITKFDEKYTPLFLEDKRYFEVADFYITEALKNDVIFEVNTKAVSEGLRTKPYPDVRILHKIRKNGGKVIISSDSHSIDTLNFGFYEAKKMLKEIGFDYVYTLKHGKFQKISISL